MKTEHTQEPWIAEGSFIGIPNGKGTFYMSPLSGINQERRESDARRIVACVNACAGIPDEQLYDQEPGCLLSAMVEQEQEIMTITKQRDELLSDVERCYRMLLSEPDTQGALFKAENILREAIASVKEKQNAAD